jgi:hypothetical protein
MVHGKSTMSYMGGKEMEPFGDFFTPMVSYLQQWLRSIDDDEDDDDLYKIL